MLTFVPSKHFEYLTAHCEVRFRNVYNVSFRYIPISGAQRSLFFMPLRQHPTLFPTFVADPPLRRNNSQKFYRNSLESAKIHRTFATSKVEVLGLAKRQSRASFLFHIA